MPKERDIEAGVGNFEEWVETDDESTHSSFESTEYDAGYISPRTPTSPRSTKPDKKKETKIEIANNEGEWGDYVREESKHLINKCRRQSKKTSWMSSFFAAINDSTELYLILFSTATFIISAIKTTYDTTDYILIGMAAVATILEGTRTLFKFKKRSIYFKQASIQYKRIYRKLTKYRYTTSTDKLADFMSVAYENVDKLAMKDRRANFNKFKSHAGRLTRSHTSK